MSNQTVLEKGNLKKSSVKTEYEFPSSKDFLSLPSNLIPGVGGVSGGRVLLGAKASLQGISLLHRETPLVQSIATKGDESFVNRFGKGLLSVIAEQAGTISSIDEHEIVIKDKDGKTHHYELYNNYNLGRKSYIHNYPQVKVGDSVKKGEVLATSNYTDDKGNLALGVNLRTAVMPYRSGNFEDAWVVSESGAKKLEAEQLIRYRLEQKMGIEVNKRKFVSLFQNKYLNSQLVNIDDDGVVKKGTLLNYGDPVLLAVSPKTLKSTDIQLGKLSKVLKNAYKDNSQTWSYEHPGEVVDVSKAGDLVTVNIKTKRGLSVGDKVSTAWGTKGVIGNIIPDTEAPQDDKGHPVDIILNSMSITSRVAPALAVALGLGKIAQKEGKPVKMIHFINESSVGNVISKLKENNIPDSEELYDPVSGTKADVLVGPLYFTRLTHIAEDKESSRSQGSGYSWDMQPTKTEEESAKRVGNLATAALLSHGATQVLKDLGTIKSTKNDEYWRRVKFGQPVPSPQVPFIFNKFIASLEGAGIKVDKKGDHFNILPQTDKDIHRLSVGPVSNPLTFKVKGETLIPEPGGLFDPSIVGILGDRYNHIDLNMSVPNPISEDYLRKLLGVTKIQYMDLITSGELKDKLSSINMDEKIKEYTKYLKSGRKTEREDSVRVLSFLNTLKKNHMAPKDLMLNKIPVIPAQFRPTIAQGDRVLSAEVNYLYKDLMLNNNALKNLEDVPEEVQQRLKKNQYDAVKSIFGLGEPITVKNREKGIRGLLASTLGIKGGSAKTTMFQAKVVNKPIELVGRAVLTPDAKLDLNDASVPQDILWKAYLPFIIRRMVQKGIPATKAAEYIKTRNTLAQQALSDELKTRPAIISRDPVLHKFNLTGFYLKPNADNKDKTIKLNPLVFKSFNADNDGDQLNVNVPASEEARKEVIDKMLPSQNLLSPKNFLPIYTPSNESALGLFQASTEDNHNTSKHYNSEADVLRDFHSGKLGVGDRVNIG
jgi:hypothetical protein